MGCGRGVAACQVVEDSVSSTSQRRAALSPNCSFVLNAAYGSKGGKQAFAAVSTKDGYAHKADIKHLASCPKALIASRARAKTN